MKRRVEMALAGLAVAAALVGAGELAGREATAAGAPRGETLLPLTVTVAQVLVYNLKQIGIDLEVMYFEPQTAINKALAPGEPYDLVMTGWAAAYPAPAGFFLALLPGGAFNVAHLDDLRVRRSIEAASLLTGEARERASADLDVDLMRNDPPWVPLAHTQRRVLVSPSVGCVVPHPVYGFDLATACKKR